MDAFIFLGPTLSTETARTYLDAVYCPPAAQGDILRILLYRPRLIGIIDGYFETLPAVWHKEILHAMAQGVHVFGASSMGALRAAELEPFGMVGLGRIFEWYRSGQLEDDDEVAVAHGPADSGYVPVSEAMVNIRHAVEIAQQQGLMPDGLASRFLSVAKALHYSERNYRRIFQMMADEIEPCLKAKLHQFFASHRPRLKEIDAMLLLVRAASFLASDPPPMRVSYSVENTVFLDAMINEGERGAAEAAAGSDGADGPVEGGLLRHEVLLRLLARREATRLGLECSDEELREASDTFAQGLAFPSVDAMQESLRRAGIKPGSFASMMQDAVLLEKLDRYYDRDIRSSVADHIRIRTFRRSAQRACDKV